LHVAGDVSFVSGSSYDVEADATSSDKIEATGSATISGGTVVLIPYHGATLTAGTSYTILTADGGVSGTFDSISFASSMLFLTATLSYDANDVYATVLRNSTSFASVAGSGNQANAAAAIESLGAGNALYDAIAMQSDVGTTRRAYQSLDGEIHANIKATLLDDQAAFGRLLAGRLAQAEDNATGLAAPVTVQASARDRLVYGDKIAHDGAASIAKIAPTVWAQGFGHWGQRDGDANAATFKHEDKGLMTGVDWMLGEAWRAGLAFGYDHADYTQEDGTGDAGKADRYSAALYGGRSWGKLRLRAGLSYAYSSIDTKRAVSFPYYSDYLKGSYEAHSASGFAETAYTFGDKASQIEPYANLTWSYVNVPGFVEQGGAAALTAKDGDATLGATTLGARVRQALPFLDAPENQAAFQATAGWRHALGDANPESKLSFAGSNTFKAQAAPLARDAAVVGAGVDYLINDQTTLGLAYTGQIGAHAGTQALRGNVSWRF
jgi:outer membrane autotransporter protein